MLLGLLAACTAVTPEPPADTAEVEAAETSEPDHATVLVQTDAHAALVRDIAFTAPISGLAALQASGLEVVTAQFDWGTAVCSIAGAGCPADDCFCGGDTFWHYAYWDGQGWQGYSTGAAQSRITATGALEGWQWGAADVEFMPAAQVEAIQNAYTWLQAQQVITDGSYGHSPSSSVEMLMALGANGLDPAAWRAEPGEPSLLDFIRTHAATYSAESVSAAGKLAMGLSAAGACWPADAQTPSSYYSDTLQAMGNDAGPLAWGIMGALALEESPDASVAHLQELALEEGGWEWMTGFGRDTNSTALAIQALTAAGVPSTTQVIQDGLAYVQTAQTESGGFSYDPNVGGGQADANSTAYVVQALLAIGEDPTGPAWRQPNGNHAYSFLRSLQTESGAFIWRPDISAVNQLATQQALPALLGRPYPLAQRALPVCEGM